MKQPHYLRCPALKLLCDSSCGPLRKKFGDLCFRQWYNSKWDTIVDRWLPKSSLFWYCIDSSETS